MVPRISLVAIALLCGATAMNSSKWLRTGGQNTYEPITDTWVVVPELKLLFCFIPKNACTQFNKLTNALNGIDKLGETCSKTDPNYKSVVRLLLDTSKGKSPKKAMAEMIRDSNWTKGVFVRDPLERLVSAFRSKCEPPRECWGMHCANLDPRKLRHDEGPTFDEWMAEFTKSTDQHFTPQARFCGGLTPKKLRQFDYVGVLITNYTQVAEQVNGMMQLAWDRSRKASAENSATFLQPKRTLTKDAVDKVVETYFPSAGPDGNRAHNHRTNNLNDYYQTPATRRKATQYYSEDYTLLKYFADRR